MPTRRARLCGRATSPLSRLAVACGHQGDASLQRIKLTSRKEAFLDVVRIVLGMLALAIALALMSGEIKAHGQQPAQNPRAADEGGVCDVSGQGGNDRCRIYATPYDYQEGSYGLTRRPQPIRSYEIGREYVSARASCPVDWVADVANWRWVRDSKSVTQAISRWHRADIICRSETWDEEQSDIAELRSSTFTQRRYDIVFVFAVHPKRNHP